MDINEIEEALIVDTMDRPSEPWQLQVFQRSIKKNEKLKSLLDVIGVLEGQKCLMITCGDNNGALNWHMKKHGGHWTWMDAETDSIDQIAQLIGEKVYTLNKDNPHLPFPDNQFNLVLTVDVHEHIHRPSELNHELARVVAPEGRVVVTTPSGDETKLANRIKSWVGMQPIDYGHVVAGYDIPSLEKQLLEVGLTPIANSSYSYFFTEIIELGINFAYVRILSRRGDTKVNVGQISPQSRDQLKSVGKSYKLYQILFPILNAIAKLDYLVKSEDGYAVIVAGKKMGLDQ